MGNPLLDITAECDGTFLSKYKLRPNDAILATKDHLSIYEEMKTMKNVEYTAGGATQNSARVCQVSFLFATSVASFRTL
jgi:adenosine kinase